MSEWDDAPMFRVKSRTCFLGKHYTPKFCKGETCRCGKPATHKARNTPPNRVTLTRRTCAVGASPT